MVSDPNQLKRTITISSVSVEVLLSRPIGTSDNAMNPKAKNEYEAKLLKLESSQECNPRLEPISMIPSCESNIKRGKAFESKQCVVSKDESPGDCGKVTF